MAGIFGDTEDLPKKKVKKKKKSSGLGGMSGKAEKALRGRAAKLKQMEKDAGI